MEQGIQAPKGYQLILLKRKKNSGLKLATSVMALLMYKAFGTLYRIFLSDIVGHKVVVISDGKNSYNV